MVKKLFGIRYVLSKDSIKQSYDYKKIRIGV